MDLPLTVYSHPVRRRKEPYLLMNNSDQLGRRPAIRINNRVSAH